ncbi:MAG: prepilin-type N-terminal cleavage/methylation domain-containing protein [Phycisphaerales bacterium]|jgi:Tfp pilus assembly protein FimT|nr:prepilin-type N-terminal cleavage/methylation domain-containing protein [Phycisphaerales bacterium]
MHAGSNPTARAYTLIEAIVVMVVLAIAAVLLIPHLSDRGDTELQAAARQLVADISWAQCDAVAGQGYRRLHFFDDGRGWCLYEVTDATFSDPFDENTAAYVEDVWRTRRGGGDFIVDFSGDERFSSVAISDVTTAEGGRELTFDQLGGTVAAPGLGAGAASVTLSDGSDNWQVGIAPVTGRVVVSRAE